MNTAAEQTKLSAVLLIAALSLTCGCDDGLATGQATPPQLEVNAADEYRSLHAALDSQLAAHLRASTGRLTPQIARSLGSARLVTDRLVWATRLPRCDWGIVDYGYAAELPHLGLLRELAWLLRADAERAIRDQELNEASEVIAAIVRMSRHVGGKTPLETMLSFSFVNYAADLARHNAGVWDKSQRDKMLAELQQMNFQNPFNIEQSIARERQMAIQKGLPAPNEQWYNDQRNKVIKAVQDAILALQ